MDQLAEAATIGAGLMEEPGEELSDGKVLLFISISAGLVVMAGLMSGLTIGLMAMDEIEMEVSRSRSVIEWWHQHGPCNDARASRSFLSSSSASLLSLMRVYQRSCMQVLKRGGTPTEQKYAAAIAPVRPTLPLLDACLPSYTANQRACAP